jgi:dienelactone hydrolase
VVTAREERFGFRAGDETLAGALMVAGQKSSCRLLFLHGAGTTDKERTRNLAVRMAEKGFSSFRFDFSGHGESTGCLAESSLQKRTREAMAALQFTDPSSSVSICAFSMGGHIALEMLRRTQDKVANLLLFAPAVYDRKAFEVPFGAGFSDIIRRHESWRDTDVIDKLREFSGSFLICIGDRDAVIPSGVIDLLANCAGSARRREVWRLAGVDHQIAKWVADDDDALELVAAKVEEYLSE